jgi:hypothetical protein
MLQVFHLDVLKVDLVLNKCFICMFQVFYLPSDVYCK